MQARSAALSPKQLMAVVRRSSTTDIAHPDQLADMSTLNSGKGQKSYMGAFHRNVTVS